MQRDHADVASQLAHHRLLAVAFHRQAHDRADLVHFLLGLQAQRVTHDHPFLLQPGNPVLHGGARHPQLLGQRHHRHPRILAQQRNQLPVQVVHPVFPAVTRLFPTLVTTRDTVKPPTWSLSEFCLFPAMLARLSDLSAPSG